MKKTLLILSLLINGSVWAQTGPWTNSGSSWVYNLGKGDGTLGKNVKGDELHHVSTFGSKATFLPMPPSGSVMVSSVTGTPSFTLLGSGDAAGLKINGSSNNGSAAKFAGYDIQNATQVVNMSFTLDLEKTSATKENWYFIIGRTAALFNQPKMGLAINRTGTSSNTSIFACFRLILDPSKPDNMKFQVRTHADLADEVGWAGTNANVFKKGSSHKVEIFCNNSSAVQNYNMGGKDNSLDARSYHIWVNGKQVGGTYAGNGMPAKRNIDAFLIMSRDASMTGETVDNAAAITIKNVKLNYSATK